MAEFTSSAQVSPFPDENILFNSASGITGQQIQQNQLMNRTRQLELSNANMEQVARASASLLSIPDEAARAEAYPRVVGMLQSQGFAKNAPAQYPGEQTLQMLARQGTPSQTQADWLSNIQANKAYSSATGTPATPGTTATPAVAPTGAGTATIGQRQNNPGNLTFAGQPNAAPGQGNRFASFPDMPTGVAANADQLALYATQHGVNTVRDAVTRWVGDPKADLTSYIGDISKSLGVGPDDKIDLTNPDVQAKFIQAQFPHESAGGGYVLNPADVAKGVQIAAARRGQVVQPTPVATAQGAPGAPAGGGGTPGPYMVASNAPVPPPGSVAAPGGAPAAPPAPGAVAGATPPAASVAPAQPATAPAGGPAPPQLPPLNARGLTPQQQAQIDAVASTGRMTLQQRMAAEQAFQQQNIGLAQKAFSDYVQLQQLAVQQGTLTNAQAETNLKYWQAAHPELAPNARVQTLAYRTLQDLAPAVRSGQATQEQVDKYNNAATEYQEFKEVQDPVTKQLKSVPTRPLPPGYPPPAGAGADGGVQTLTPGLSPAQQQIERDPAAYKVSEAQYDRDSKEVAAIGDAGRQSQADQVRIKEMQDVLQKFNSGRGTEAATAAAAWFNSWAPAGLTGWQKESANLSGSQAAEAFSKLALVGAGTQERGVLGARGGYQAIKLFKEANPNINLQDATNKSILDMQLISNQANQDYSQAALSHFADNEKKFSTTHNYDSLAQFDRNWNAQRNPQVYSAAMGAISGQPASQWTKGLSDDEYARALQIVQRAKPTAIVQTKSGPYSLQPQSTTPGAPVPAAGTKVIRFDHNGNVIQ